MIYILFYIVGGECDCYCIHFLVAIHCVVKRGLKVIVSMLCRRNIEAYEKLSPPSVYLDG